MSHLGHLGPNAGHGRDNEIEEHIYEQVRPKNSPSRPFKLISSYLACPIVAVLLQVFGFLFVGICLITCVNTAIQGFINVLWILDDDGDNDNDGHAALPMRGYEFSMPPTCPPSPQTVR
ncbi:uncharacterized protein B0T15DRAFT_490201 [Chaetomium strumarium]|uniref:Uncharacterized protein n=1 Tax=Chaetomium strumarium TaxID=1170767 RepID=A0AAJ0H4H2_9PEZI|nr:hypothetical protein B0T15DRAFT_490201 [Chaetomium strumarium]